MMATKSTRRGSALSGFAMMIGIVGVYLALQLWVLPAAGIPT
jgi:hypothetical protein